MAQQSLSYPKDKIKILLLEGIHPSAVKEFKAAGYTKVELLKEALSEEKLIEAVQGIHILGIRSRTQVTEKVVSKARHLLTIGCFCIGTDQVDLKAAKLAGVPVFNAPFSNTRSVAELTIGHIVYLMRGIPQKNWAAHEGKWLKSATDSYEIRGKTLGIVGYGRIGIQTGLLAEALGMEVIFYDPADQLPFGNARPTKDLAELLKMSDVVSLHVPDTPRTNRMIGRSELKLMKPGAKLINLSRGMVLDLDAVTEALKSGALGGAAVDVFPKEPSSSKEKFDSALQQLENVVLTPHIGGSTIEAQTNIGIEVAKKMVAYSDVGSTSMAVNFPVVELPPQQGKHRLLHIHANRPGVLSEINEYLSANGANIAAQYLQTDPEIGYVVIDLDKQENLDVRQLKQIAHSIRARILY